jgi:uncharacterized membrane protein
MNKRVALVAILALAFALRLVGLRYGLPFVYNPDEVAIMSRALAFAKGDLNPHNFLYPSLYFYLLFAWEGLTALAAVATRAVSSFGAFQREFFLDPTRVYVAGRLLTALLGTATVAATARLAERLDGPRAGLIAALFLAVLPLHVVNSHYVKHDVPVTLLIVLACLAYEQLWREELPPEGGSYVLQGGSYLPQGASYLPLAVAAAVTGAAFSTHYYTAFLAIPLAWSAAHGARDRGDAMKRILIAGAIATLVFFICSPFILAEPATALRDIRANRQIVVDRAVGQIGYLGTVARYAKMMIEGPMAVLLIGAAVGAWSTIDGRQTRRRALMLLSFPCVFLLFVFSTYPASRYLVPLTPFLAVFAAVTFARAFEMDKWTRVGSITGLVIVVTAGAVESLWTDLFIRQTDTRTLAAQYIDANIPPGATILTQPYSVPLEHTREVLREAVSRNGREMPTKTALQLERNPYPSPAYRVLYLGRGMDADKLYVQYADVGRQGDLSRLRAEHVAFIVLKRYNDDDPATLPLLAALAREGRRLAVFSPYRHERNAADSGRGPRPEPFLHNTDARIDAALERPGPVVEIWKIDGPRS